MVNTPRPKTDLGNLEAKLVPDLLIGIEQQRHTAGGGGLLVGYSGAFGRFPDDAQAQCDRARRAQDHIGTFGAQLGNVFQQTLEEAITRSEELLVGEEGRTDFDDDVSFLGHIFRMLRRLEISRAQYR